MFLMLGAVEVT